MVFALVVLAVSVSAQGRYNYDSGHKYGFFSNWTLGVAGQYANQHGVSDIGISALATKRVGDFWRLRYVASINGLKKAKGFDRYGTAMAGVSLDFVEWAYLFGDAGAIYNPSMQARLGLAADAGLGLNVNFGKHSILYVEGGSDLVQHNADWDNTFFARLGYQAKLGITERDRVNIDIDKHVHGGYGELKQENQLLKTDLKRQQEANDTLVAIQNKSLEMLARLEKRLDDCNKQVAEAAKNATTPASSFSQIYFRKGSAEISPIEEGKVQQLADYINGTTGTFRIEGYASPEGDVYVNEQLSGDRARAVYWMLIGYGVDADRLIPVSGGVTDRFGEDSPLNRMVTVTKTDY